MLLWHPRRRGAGEPRPGVPRENPHRQYLLFVSYSTPIWRATFLQSYFMSLSRKLTISSELNVKMESPPRREAAISSR